MTDEAINSFSDDFVLEKVIGSTESEFINHAMVFHPQEAVYRAREKLLRWVRRRVVRRTEYKPDLNVRFPRRSQPWSWVEDRIMEFAFTGRDSETPENVVVDNEYVASLLMRTVEEVTEKRNTKNGIRGFDL